MAPSVFYLSWLHDGRGTDADAENLADYNAERRDPRATDLINGSSLTLRMARRSLTLNPPPIVCWNSIYWVCG
jgi:hypothetical protein